MSKPMALITSAPVEGFPFSLERAIGQQINGTSQPLTPEASKLVLGHQDLSLALQDLLPPDEGGLSWVPPDEANLNQGVWLGTPGIALFGGEPDTYAHVKAHTRRLPTGPNAGETEMTVSYILPLGWGSGNPEVGIRAARKAVRHEATRREDTTEVTGQLPYTRVALGLSVIVNRLLVQREASEAELATAGKSSPE